MAALSVVRLKPIAPKRACADYDLDAFVIELHETTLDFRFQLGQGLGIYWALAAATGDRLRLLHVDGAAYTVDEPELVQDPFVFDLPRLEWRGDLGTLHDGSLVTYVSIEVTADPPHYRCEVTRRVSGEDVTHAFAWRAAPSR